MKAEIQNTPAPRTLPEISDAALESVDAAVNALASIKTRIILDVNGLDNLRSPERLAETVRQHQKALAKVHELGAELTEALAQIDLAERRATRVANAGQRKLRDQASERAALKAGIAPVTLLG